MFFKQNGEKYITPEMCSSANNAGSGHLLSLKTYWIYEHFIFSCLEIHENREDSRRI